MQNNASSKHPRKERITKKDNVSNKYRQTKSSKVVNANQFDVDKHPTGSIHLVDQEDPQPSSTVHTISEARTS